MLYEILSEEIHKFYTKVKGEEKVVKNVSYVFASFVSEIIIKNFRSLH